MAVSRSSSCGMLAPRPIAMAYDNSRALQLLRVGTGRPAAQFRDGQDIPYSASISADRPRAKEP
jgi:hypothetical protein